MLIFSPFSRFFKLNVEVTFSIFQFKYSITLCQPILLFISFSGSGSRSLNLDSDTVTWAHVITHYTFDNIWP